jgi:hypothetical protein
MADTRILDERVPGDAFRPAQEAWHQRWNDALDAAGADHAHTNEDYDVVAVCRAGAGCLVADGEALPAVDVATLVAVR